MIEEQLQTIERAIAAMQNLRAPPWDELGDILACIDAIREELEDGLWIVAVEQPYEPFFVGPSGREEAEEAYKYWWRHTCYLARVEKG